MLAELGGIMKNRRLSFDPAAGGRRHRFTFSSAAPHAAALLVALALPATAAALPVRLEPDLSDLQDVCPPMEKRDREFDGHGPRVEANADLVLAPGARSISLSRFFKARETVRDWSRAEHTEVDALYDVPGGPCTVITSIDSDTSSALVYVDRDHDVDYFPQAAGELVSRFKVRGDTSGKDIGNCSHDDTKYWHEYNPLRITVDLDASDPACRRSDGRPADVTRVDGAAIMAALNTVAANTSMRLHNVDLATTPFSFAPNQSFIRLALPGGLALQSDFSVQPIQEGRYTIFVDDINSTAVTIEPDGGGYMLGVSFETSGVELRSNCDSKFLDSPDAWVACALGNELRVDLDRIDAKVRLYLDVDASTGAVRFRPAHPINPERDVFVDVGVRDQSGPCKDNVLAIAHDCMELDELELAIQAAMTSAIANLLQVALDPANQPTNMFGDIISTLMSFIGPIPGELIGILVSDEEERSGDIFLITR